MTKRDLSMETFHSAVQQERPYLDCVRALVCLMGQQAAREYFNKEAKKDFRIKKPRKKNI